MSSPKFKIHSQYQPAGDQPTAIKKLYAGISAGQKYQTLLGVTGSGKTFTMANVIEKTQKPTLVISHNKTLAAQLYQEFKEFFPENSVHYFVSYYDYYQPEAYMPTTDTYIEKDAKINEHLDRLRHEATQAILSRNDVIVIASVSCIYNIGSPVNYEKMSLEISAGQKITQKELSKHLIALQYIRNDIEKLPGTFNRKGETIEIYPSSGNEFYQIEFNLSGNKIDSIAVIASHPLASGWRGNLNTQIASSLLGVAPRNDTNSIKIFPAKFWTSPQTQINLALANIKKELNDQLKKFKKENKPLEYERLKQRVNFDIEMLKQSGYCHGIENYSGHLEFRESDSPPFTLIDYFRHAYGDDFLFIIDESHMTIPQIRAMHAGDKARKTTLVDYGWRLPSALDNRPLRFNEFEEKNTQTVFVSATPADYELKNSCHPPMPFGRVARSVLATKPARLDSHSGGQSLDSRELFDVGRQTIHGNDKCNIVEQLIRPTGLLDPQIEVRPTKNQIPDLLKEIRLRVIKKQKIFVTVLTKRLAEEMAEYLAESGFNAYYLHSEIKTLERTEILRDLRLDKYDIIVGVNLLREGLDIPEISFIAIMDADKEGFLRNKTTLVQTIGRAARNIEGKVIMYADKMTQSMKGAMEETNRRRKIQEEYNKTHNITPTAIIKPIRDLIINQEKEENDKKIAEIISDEAMLEDLSSQDPKKTIKILEKEMKKAASQMNFELAARLRDKINGLRKWV